MEHDSRRKFTRRETMRMLGIGAGVGVAIDWGYNPDLLAGSLAQIRVGKRTLNFPRDAIVRTVLNDIDPNTIDGATLMHEHLGSGRPGRRGGRRRHPVRTKHGWLRN